MTTLTDLLLNTNGHIKITDLNDVYFRRLVGAILYCGERDLQKRNENPELIRDWFKGIRNTFKDDFDDRNIIKSLLSENTIVLNWREGKSEFFMDMDRHHFVTYVKDSLTDNGRLTFEVLEGEFFEDCTGDWTTIFRGEKPVLGFDLKKILEERPDYLEYLSNKYDSSVIIGSI